MTLHKKFINLSFTLFFFIFFIILKNYLLCDVFSDCSLTQDEYGGDQNGFFVCIRRSGLQRRLVLALKNCRGHKRGPHTAFITDLGEANFAARSCVRRAADQFNAFACILESSHGSGQSETALVARIARQQELPLFV